MLKRQRPATPPIPSMPTWSDPSSLDSMMMEREHKRRRTSSITPLDEPWKDWGNRLQAITFHADNCQRGGEVSPEPSGSEYKSANATLRELHTLQQHRLLFASPAFPFQSTLELSKRTASIPFGRTGSGLETPSIDEQMQVKERYEETNRLLGSTLVSRRRELGLDESLPH